MSQNFSTDQSISIQHRVLRTRIELGSVHEKALLLIWIVEQNVVQQHNTDSKLKQVGYGSSDAYIMYLSLEIVPTTESFKITGEIPIVQNLSLVRD